MQTTEAAYPQVRWDLSALFSSIDDPKIEQTLGWAEKEADAFADAYRGKVADLDGTGLAEAIRRLEGLSSEAGKPLTYAHLLFATNTGDPKLGAFMQKMQERLSEIQVRIMFFELELQGAPESWASRIIEDDSLANYRHWLKLVRLYSEHRLSEPEEVLLEKTANTGSRAWVRLFEEVTANHVFKVKLLGSDEIEEMSMEEAIDLLRDPDRGVRQAAADAITEGLGELQRVIVFTYNNLLQDKKIEDDLRRFEYPEQSRHLSNELDAETVNLVVEQCRNNYDLVERFYHIKREILGLPELTHIDRYAPLFEARATVEYSRAREMVVRAFADFSPEMAQRAEEFFDSNWVDAEPRKGKMGGAFCSYNTPDTHPVVMMSYLNKMDDVMTLAHELGHGVHASFSREQTPFNYHGTLPLAELASIFGEMLVFENVVKEATRRDKLALYGQKIEGMFASVFRQAAMFQFEQECHRVRREEGELPPEDFAGIWQEKLQEMFGNALKLGEQHSNWWSYVGHFFFAPFYVYAYSFGELLVLSLYQRAKEEGPSFSDKYVALLKLGGSESPQELMSRVGVDLKSPEFWQGGFDAMEAMVSEFERIWGEEKGA